MPSKRNKPKKMTPAIDARPPEPSSHHDDLMDDLFAQLDSKDELSRQKLEETEPHANPESNADEGRESSFKKQTSKMRHLARQARKTATIAQSFAPSNPDLEAQIDREIKQEAASIKRTCDELAVQIHEINPDGHCLFSAIADQLALLNILPPNDANYTTIRAAASRYLSQHPDDFLPFLPSISGEDGFGATENSGLMSKRQFGQYCAAIKETAAWGGEPEILALSRAYNVPIQVVQAGSPSVVTHSPDGHLPNELPRHAKVARISFHRRMYGLGEHYNSLRPKNPLIAVADKIHLMLT